MLLGKYDRPNRERPPAKRVAALGFDRLEPHDRKVRIGAADRNPEVDHRSPHSTFAGRTPAQTLAQHHRIQNDYIASASEAVAGSGRRAWRLRPKDQCM